MSQSGSVPFWRVKRLDQMSEAEWESLCDGCGRCCLHKLRDDDTGDLEFTNVACRMLNLESCTCRDYANRSREVPDCIALTPSALSEIDWLPPSCAYRLVAERRDLPDWHPLITGNASSTCNAGASVAGRAISETDAGPLEHHIVAWPARWPKNRPS
ncbi:MAG: YcgN family cysteine cluster protein [Acidiphilium sp.]|nr:YcgN family cysteine cluster protein [Acidiphilium sp.]MDD4934950.1 YcgN family cysteine cluster protein [Acidiphilium sp.]